jgi:hypothetical protein
MEGRAVGDGVLVFTGNSRLATSFLMEQAHGGKVEGKACLQALTDIF